MVMPHNALAIRATRDDMVPEKVISQTVETELFESVCKNLI